MSDKFFKYLTRFCKIHNTQHALLNMIENWKSNLNKGSKIYKLYLWTCIKLLIAKFETYGFDGFLIFMKNYLTNRKQRCKVENCFSIRKTITSGVPQGSILETLSFNIFVNFIFSIR